MSLKLVTPSAELIADYIEAVNAGFRNMQLGFGDITAERIKNNIAGYIEKINSRTPFPVRLENHKNIYTVTRHELLWVTDGSRFIGSIALRYGGDSEMLDLYAGHWGIAIHPALRGQGIGKQVWTATRGDVVQRMRKEGHNFMYVTCHPENMASARLIEFAGGKFMERTSNVLGQGPSLRYRIDF